ncbi:MAG: hypothetical protein JO097_17655 [Acidobacteriaceae bacterium]|nr:hypothetical protein [Acidobacteriaceae bacterium]MBV9764299.1 hypothetical protein [Acidobacteriaceae bacterium]
MEPTLPGLILDSSIIIEAERNGQTVEDLLIAIRERFSEIEIAVPPSRWPSFVHGIERANTPEIRAPISGVVRYPQ